MHKTKSKYQIFEQSPNAFSYFLVENGMINHAKIQTSLKFNTHI